MRRRFHADSTAAAPAEDPSEGRRRLRRGSFRRMEPPSCHSGAPLATPRSAAAPPENPACRIPPAETGPLRRSRPLLCPAATVKGGSQDFRGRLREGSAVHLEDRGVAAHAEAADRLHGNEPASGVRGAAVRLCAVSIKRSAFTRPSSRCTSLGGGFTFGGWGGVELRDRCLRRMKKLHGAPPQARGADAHGQPPARGRGKAEGIVAERDLEDRSPRESQAKGGVAKVAFRQIAVPSLDLFQHPADPVARRGSGDLFRFGRADRFQVGGAVGGQGQPFELFREVPPAEGWKGHGADSFEEGFSLSGSSSTGAAEGAPTRGGPAGGGGVFACQSVRDW